MPILRGKNVLLRPYRRSDLPGILSWTNDTEATRYLTEIFDKPYTEKNGEDFLNYALSGGSDRMMFVMADPVTEEYWGQISLERISRRDGTAEVDVVLAKEEHRGKGIGREALSLLLRYAFDTLGLRRVELTVFAENSRARLCYLKRASSRKAWRARKRGRTASSTTLCPWQCCATSGQNGRNRHDRGQENPPACV